jgi:hypothetical protein
VVPVVDGLGASEYVLWALEYEIAVAQKPYVLEQCYMLVVPWR